MPSFFGFLRRLPLPEPQSSATRLSRRGSSFLPGFNSYNAAPTPLPVPQVESPLSPPILAPSPALEHQQSSQIPSPVRPHPRASSSVSSSSHIDDHHQTVNCEPNATNDPSTEIFYGAFFDEYKRPTDVFKRIADALFYYMDTRCDIFILRDTGVIEPQKYAWMRARRGSDRDVVSLIEKITQTYYDAGMVPYKMQELADGTEIPVLDRKGWLTLQVFEARSDPQNSYDFWDWATSNLDLRDPLTSMQFPKPLPRQALPLEPDHLYELVYQTWFKTGAASIGDSDISPEAFYGALFDEHKRPTDTFKRMVDALFFYMDKRCDVRRFRNTNVVEPEKYGWMLQRRGISQTAIFIIETNIQTYYDVGRVTYEIRALPDGTEIPVLDRKGWLKLQVFEARCNPQNAYDFWDGVVMVCNLRDPLTGMRFPVPLPRQSFPDEPDSNTQRAYHAWRKTATAPTPIARASQNQDTAPNMPVPNSPDANFATSPATQPASPAADADASVPPLSIRQPQQPAPASGGTVEALASAVSSIAGAAQAFAPGGGGNSSPTSTMGPTMVGPVAPSGYGATPSAAFGPNAMMPGPGSPFGTQSQQPQLGVDFNVG